MSSNDAGRPADAVYPPDGASAVGDDSLPVDSSPHPTRYALDVGSDQNFTPGHLVNTSLTASTTFVPGDEKRSASRTRPTQGSNVFWRVRALNHHPVSSDERRLLRHDRFNIAGSRKGFGYYDVNYINHARPTARTVQGAHHPVGAQPKDANFKYFRIEVQGPGGRHCVHGAPAALDVLDTHPRDCSRPTATRPIPARAPDRGTLDLREDPGRRREVLGPTTVYQGTVLRHPWCLARRRVARSPRCPQPSGAGSPRSSRPSPGSPTPPRRDSAGPVPAQISETPNVIISSRRNSHGPLGATEAYPPVTDLRAPAAGVRHLRTQRMLAIDAASEVPPSTPAPGGAPSGIDDPAPG